MKKILTFSLVALLAVAGFAKIKPNAQKVYRPQANVELSSKQITTTVKESKAVLATKPERVLKGNRLVRPMSYPYNPNYGASFCRPLNSFYCGFSTGGSSFMYNRLFVPAFSTLTFENSSTDLFEWAYTDPYTEEELTSDETNLTFDVGEYNFVGAPVLTMPGTPTDTVYTIADYMQIAGKAYYDFGGTSGWLGACNYDPEWLTENWYYSTSYYAANVPSVNSTYTQDYAEYGVDTVKVVGYGELINKPTSPYILYDVSMPMLIPQAGELTLAVYKAIQDEEGNWELGDRISNEVTINFKEANMGAITFAEFKDLLGIDPETGLEETLVIDDAVFVLLTTSVQNHPLFFYHKDPLPTERHAFNLINYTMGGEEYEMIDDVNYQFGSGIEAEYMSSFAFNYNIEMPYLHNNEETDTFDAPVEGGEKTFNIASYYSSEAWEITDTEYQDIPDWITVDLEDGSEEYQGQLYYNGVTDATFTVAALPEGVDYRSADVMLSYDGAKCIIHVTQGDAAQPVPGDVDGDGHVTAGDITLLYNVMLNNDYTGVVNGDQDGDGNITAGDVTFIYNILLGTN